MVYGLVVIRENPSEWLTKLAGTILCLISMTYESHRQVCSECCRSRLHFNNGSDKTVAVRQNKFLLPNLLIYSILQSRSALLV